MPITIVFPTNGMNCPTLKCRFCGVSQEMADVFEAIQGNFRQIRSLTRRQKDHLKRFHGESDTSRGTSVGNIQPGSAMQSLERNVSDAPSQQSPISFFLLL